MQLLSRQVQLVDAALFSLAGSLQVRWEGVLCFDERIVLLKMLTLAEWPEKSG